MDIFKFLKSFNTSGTYLAFASMLLLSLVVYFYLINPA
ncbi:hypothetical protein QR674_05705 [Acinetobacter chinensis]|uniref:Uncharacterized protein n=1 Tax=Acinetobacter chinensis TaxID=2004650 RepID=A0ABU3WDJ0_9GAMM|nr:MULTISPECIES: hypothetical protein [Acinetobacter]MDV2468474.1 hypothetical protein [Acinetobacter chinensis]WOE40117.1 hypothetical protein QSG87_09340 [Acinetobacter chinensis]